MTWLHGRDTQLLIFTVSLFLFGTLCFDMLQSYLPSEADRETLSVMADHRTGFITAVLSAFTFLGSSIPITIFAFATAVLIAVRARAWQPLLLATAATVFVPLLNQQIKHTVDRPRPAGEYQVMDAGGYSFPSAHSMNSAAIIGISAFLIYTATRSQKVRDYTVMIAAFFVLMVGISRLYLGAHWLTDVVGGLALGVACMLVMAWVFHRVVPGDRLLARPHRQIFEIHVRERVTAAS